MYYRRCFFIRESETVLTAEEQKEKIRRRYQGVNPDELEVIPALPQDSIYEDKMRRVAVYARVSTGDPRQTSSYELQRNHYLDVVNRNPSWNLVDIYADEGISGTSLAHRDAFIKMMKDCADGKIDLIVTKSVSRFARNIIDCISYVRQLKAMNPPIGIYFETESIFTLDGRSDMQLAFMATTAQEESHNKSEIMNASIEMRFRRGIFLTPKLLGYDHDEDGNLIVNEEEAKTVRLIFFMYLYGYTCQEIADQLTLLERKTKTGRTEWSPSTVLQQLQNERHCGDVLARKTWTPDYLTHKSKKNRQDRNQYRQTDHHEAIISRDDFLAVQMMIANARYGAKGILPALQTIRGGALNGFVVIHPRWQFTAEDYAAASESAARPSAVYGSTGEYRAQPGEIDLRSFQVARREFFNTRCISMTISWSSIAFSKQCNMKMNYPEHIEMLIHPGRKVLVVRLPANESKTSVEWSKGSGEALYGAKPILGAAFLPMIFTICGWKAECKYKITGVRRSVAEQPILVFDLKDATAFLPNHEENIDPIQGKKVSLGTGSPMLSSKRFIGAFPAQWSDGYGSLFYRHAQAIVLSYFEENGKWPTEETEFDAIAISPSTEEELSRNIAELLQQMSETGGDNGSEDHENNQGHTGPDHTPADR